MRSFVGIIIGGMGGLLLGIVLGVAFALGVGYWQTGGVNIPYNMEHNTIADSISVYVSGRKCELKHVFTSVAEFVPLDIINIIPFAQGGEFTQSLWVFSKENNVQIAMTIWGGAETSENKIAYLIEFGRLTFEQVKISGVTFTIEWPASSHEGYCLVDLNYP